MVLLKLRSNLDDRKVLLDVRLSTSAPSLSLSAADDPPFQVILSIRIVSSVEPGRPVTICTQGSAFRYISDANEGLDALSSPALSNLINVFDGDREIPLGRFFTNPARDKNYLSPNLGRRGVQFITVPGDGSEVRVPHDLSLKRIFKYAEGLKRDDLQSGERYQVFANDGYIGTTWWCWGSLDDDLKEKKLCAWAKGSEIYNDVNKPSEGEIEKEGYVLGEDIETMWFEDQPEGGRFAEFDVVA